MAKCFENDNADRTKRGESRCRKVPSNRSTSFVFRASLVIGRCCAGECPRRKVGKHPCKTSRAGDRPPGACPLTAARGCGCDRRREAQAPGGCGHPMPTKATAYRPFYRQMSSVEMNPATKGRKNPAREFFVRCQERRAIFLSNKLDSNWLQRACLKEKWRLMWFRVAGSFRPLLAGLK